MAVLDTIGLFIRIIPFQDVLHRYCIIDDQAEQRGRGEAAAIAEAGGGAGVAQGADFVYEGEEWDGEEGVGWEEGQYE